MEKSEADSKKKKVDRKNAKGSDKLSVGTLIKNKQENIWEVTKKLGTGGFGAVYRVECIKHWSLEGTVAALKTEFHMAKNDSYRHLHFEGIVLETIKTASIKLNKPFVHHFPELLDRGRTESYKFLVMTLAGPSLYHWRLKWLEKTNNWTKNTVFVIALQTLQTIWALHQVGFVYRDIKPDNFCKCFHKNSNLIVMINFEIFRRIYSHTAEADWVFKPPRQKRTFLGTPTWASLVAHETKEHGRKDDLETWIYFIF